MKINKLAILHYNKRFINHLYRYVYFIATTKIYQSTKNDTWGIFLGDDEII